MVLEDGYQAKLKLDLYSGASLNQYLLAITFLTTSGLLPGPTINYKF